MSRKRWDVVFEHNNSTRKIGELWDVPASEELFFDWNPLYGLGERSGLGAGMIETLFLASDFLRCLAREDRRRAWAVEVTGGKDPIRVRLRRTRT